MALVVGLMLGLAACASDADPAAPAATERTDDAPQPAEPATIGVSLPIDYPVGQELPDLGEAPGPLAAIWVIPGVGAEAPEVVGVAAETAMFGTLPIDLSLPDSTAPFAPGVALSPDGQKVAYRSTTEEVVVRDLVSGESSSPLAGIETRDDFTWYDEVGLHHAGPEQPPDPLIGHLAGGTDDEGWMWKPGQAPELIHLSEHMWGPSAHLQPYGNRDIGVESQGSGPQSCSPPTVENWVQPWELPGLCDVLHLVEAIPSGNTYSVYWLGHWGHSTDDSASVVAVPVLWGHPGRLTGNEADAVERHVIVNAGAPERVTFATELVGEALGIEVGAP